MDIYFLKFENTKQKFLIQTCLTKEEIYGMLKNIIKDKKFDNACQIYDAMQFLEIENKGKFLILEYNSGDCKEVRKIT